MDLPRDSASSGDHENQAHVERGLGNDDRDGSTKREAPFPNVAKVRCPPGVTHARGSCSGGGARGEVMRVNSPVRALELVDRGPSRQVSVDLTPENCRCCREDCQCQEHRASSRELVVAAVVEEETLAVPSHTARAFRTSADGVCIVRSAVLVAEVEVTAPVDTKPGETVATVILAVGFVFPLMWLASCWLLRKKRISTRARCLHYASFWAAIVFVVATGVCTLAAVLLLDEDLDD